jgi:hypothetical protein
MTSVSIQSLGSDMIGVTALNRDLIKKRIFLENETQYL